MEKNYIINEKKYKLIENYNNGFDKEQLENKLTDYFDLYDYVVGDWSYGKLRLKGFCNKKNKIYKSINDIHNKDKYLKENCAYGCKYFVIEKVKDS